jgi:hypothetical protein
MDTFAGPTFVSASERLAIGYAIGYETGRTEAVDPVLDGDAIDLSARSQGQVDEGALAIMELLGVDRPRQRQARRRETDVDRPADHGGDQEHRECEQEILAEGGPQDSEGHRCAEGGPATGGRHQLVTLVPGTGTDVATSWTISEADVPRI